MVLSFQLVPQSYFILYFSTCYCWAVMTHGEITAVSPRMYETSLEISLRNVLFEKPEVSLYPFLRKKGLGTWRSSSNRTCSHEMLSCWEVWGTNSAWGFPQGHGCFWTQRDKTFLISFLLFSMAGIFRMLQGGKEQSDKKYYRKSVIEFSDLLVWWEMYFWSAA